VVSTRMQDGRGTTHTPIAVEPSLMASREYSTWKRRPSGEKVLYIVNFSGNVVYWRACLT
jgi:hypothetical protein